MAKASVLILTLNEEINLADCLASCAWSDDIVVFDSYSSDRTVEIARAAGARVYQRTFDNYAAQRTAALQDIEYRHPWVLMVDADEQVPSSLAGEIERALSDVDARTAMFRMRRKDVFFGRWLRRSSGYPTWFGRLVRLGHVRIERQFNEEFLTDGGIVELQEHLEHRPFNKGVAWWYERHNRYSTMEAALSLVERTTPIDLRRCLSADPAVRRRNLKRVAYRMPARPLIVFLYLYIARFGCLDGLPGLYYSAMRASFELMIDLKVRELKRRQRHLPI